MMIVMAFACVKKMLMMAFTWVKIDVRDFYDGFHLGHFFRPKRVGGFRGGGLPSIHLEGQDLFILSLSQQLHNHHCLYDH